MSLTNIDLTAAALAAATEDEHLRSEKTDTVGTMPASASPSGAASGTHLPHRMPA
ncbi:MAG: hypothetical protein RIK87_09705 [Fuerstiella sp.]